MLQKLSRDLLVLGSFDNHHAAKSIPAGEVIEVLGSAADDRFVKIRVDGEIFEAFETDVRESGEPMRTHQAPQ